jgi:hypothetical protein
MMLITVGVSCFGICKSGNCEVSDIVRALRNKMPFREETRTFCDYLSFTAGGSLT